MSQFDYQQFYRRNLPHIHPPGATLFVTFRLAGSIPQPVMRQYRAQKNWLEEELQSVGRVACEGASSEVINHENHLLEFKRRWFRKFEDLLHQEKFGHTWLREERIAKIVADSLHYLDGKVYRLDAFCIMPNHVHAVFAPLLSEHGLRLAASAKGTRYASEDPAPSQIMHSLKGYIAREANRALGRQGAFWEHESYDHVVRDEREYDRIVAYVLNNPVKAGLARNWQQWGWSFQRENCTANFQFADALRS
jgi:REP element-mobilizing transposase RayT